MFNVTTSRFKVLASYSPLLLAFLACAAGATDPPKDPDSGGMPLPTASVSHSLQETPQEPRSSTSLDTLGILMLRDGSKFKTTLYELKVIGRLKTERKLPYYILAGRGCQECDANTSIYIHSPSDCPMKNEAEQHRLVYPGKITDYETGSPLYGSRMFYGDCLSDHPNAVVWFEHFLGDNKQWHDRVFLAEVKKDNLVTSSVNGKLPDINEAAEAGQNGHCHELPGIDGPSEP